MANDIEVWKDVVGYEGLYEVSNLGKVRSLNRQYIRSDGKRETVKGRILKPYTNKYGYAVVQLSDHGKATLFRIHRLVALAFIDNPYNKEQVNHINENKLDNRAENLEWVTCKENINHGTAPKRRAITRGKPVIRTDKDGNEKWFPSICEAARQSDAVFQCVSKCCLGFLKQHKGYKWQFAEGETKIDRQEHKS